MIKLAAEPKRLSSEPISIVLGDESDDEIRNLEMDFYKDHLSDSPKEPPAKKKLLSIAPAQGIKFDDDDDSEDDDRFLSSIPSQEQNTKGGPSSGWLTTRTSSQSSSSGTSKKPAKTLRNLW